MTAILRIPAIMGIVAIMAIQKTRDAGFTLIELLIVISIIGILAATSMALYRNARIRGDEAAAIATLTMINQAQFAFSQACGNQRYAPSLVALATPMPSTGQPFLSRDLGVDPLDKGGYRIALAGTVVTDGGTTCINEPPVETYRVTADPQQPGYSGIRYFATNTDRVLFEDLETFATDMTEAGAPPHGAEMK
jgi:prepilin-type N-terminal cleavage/methylation domain-containing protein